MAIHLGRASLRASRDQPGRLGPETRPAPALRRRGAPSLFGLAPDGACRAAPVARSAVRSYRTLSPLPAPVAPADGRQARRRSAFCGAFPGKARRPAEPARPSRRGLPGVLFPWSPDFPPGPPARGGRRPGGHPADRQVLCRHPAWPDQGRKRACRQAALSQTGVRDDQPCMADTQATAPVMSSRTRRARASVCASASPSTREGRKRR